MTGTGQDIQSELSEPAIESSATDENRSNWKSTAYSTTKSAVNPVKESADVVPPLKSVIGGLSVILDHCDVRYTSRSTLPTILTALLANSRVSQNDRIFDASSRRVGTIAKCTCYRGRSQGRTEEGDPQTVTSRSPRPWVGLMSVIY